MSLAVTADGEICANPLNEDADGIRYSALLPSGLDPIGVGENLRKSASYQRPICA